jgi:hypothetical protein
MWNLALMAFMYFSNTRQLKLIAFCYRDNKIDECGLDLCFAADFEVLGKLTQHELKEGGAHISVTDENKEEYLKYGFLFYLSLYVTVIIYRLNTGFAVSNASSRVL